MTRRALSLFIVSAFVFFASGNAGSLTIIAVGDIMMGSDYPTNMLPPYGGAQLFAGVDSILRSSDLTIGNLEGVILDGGICTKIPSRGKVYAFRTPTYFALNLAEAGFDFLNLANNHMNDFGYGGIESTKENLKGLGIQFGGPGGMTGTIRIIRTAVAQSGDSTYRVMMADSADDAVPAESVSIAIACFATSPGADLIFNVKEAQNRVAGLAKEHDIVIVSFHGGGEGLAYLHTRDALEYFLDRPRGNVVEFSRAVIDSGADLVWGHGPHVPRAIEMYRGRMIAYSLGNFCTWGFNTAGELGYAPILKIVLDPTGAFVRGEIISAIQKAGRPPTVDELDRAAKLMARLSIEDFPGSTPYITEWGSIRSRITRRVEPYSF